MIKTIIIILLSLFAISAQAQRLFKKLPSKHGITSLEIDTTEFKKIKKEKKQHLKLDSLDLQRIESNTNIIFSDGSKPKLLEVIRYDGKISGDAGSRVSITFTEDEVMGLICNSKGNHVIGKDRSTGKHVVYNDKDLRMPPFECSVQGDSGITGMPSPLAMQTTKKVRYYWEVDYDITLNKGGSVNTSSYMLGIFNQHAMLYVNDGICIELQTLFIWTTPDPYTSTTTSGNLSQFGAYRTTFSGDLAHLIGLKGGGGIAYMNGLCSSNSLNRKAYSGISTTYNNIPVYSWTIEVITHEEGHLLGSNHTHDCAWNGNFTKIDSCGDKAGYAGSGFNGCPLISNATIPFNGGTIMGYCHLTTSGINFSKGFGEQPRNRMISKINAAPCLIACITPPPPPVTIKIDSIKTNTVYKAQLKAYWSLVSGATSYKFYYQQVSNNGTGTMGLTTVSPRVFSLSANISYRIWFEARNASGIVLAISPKIIITTGTGITYK